MGRHSEVPCCKMSYNNSNSSGSPISRLRYCGSEYLAPLIACLALTLALTWPLPLYFTRSLIGLGDVNWGVGTLWYWQQAILGYEPWYYATRLYYPQGITFVTNSAGPFSALFSLPFWSLGPAAAYNAAIVLGFALTGYCMYLLARDIGASRPAAWIAGLLFMMAPLHLFAVYGHINKVFLGLIPFALLVMNRALSFKRWRLWAILTGPMLVLAFFQAPEQFVLAALGCICLAIYALAAARPDARGSLFARVFTSAISIGLCTVPLFLLITGAAISSGISANSATESALHQPDLLQFFVPPGLGILPHTRLLNQWLTPNAMSVIETAVFLSWAGLLLCLLAWLKNRREAARWLLILAVSMLISLGSTLRVFDDSWITQLDLPMPYAFLNSLPGLNTMRTPGRFMLLGSAAFAAAAALGVDQMRKMVKPAVAAVLMLLLVTYILLESWVIRFPDQQLLATPSFYQEIAGDPDEYGVLDLPIRASTEDVYTAWHIYFASFFQLDQITHGKGIATGYVSRYYPTHPQFAHFISQNFDTVSPEQEDLTVDGQPSSRYDNLRYYLARNNYRYVVFHKPSEQHPVYKPGSWGEEAAQRLIQDVFGNKPPLVDDEVSTVYAVGPAPDVATLKPSIALLEPEGDMGWKDFRTPKSPAAFLVHSPRALLTHLDVRLEALQSSRNYAVLTLQSGDGNVTTSLPVAPKETFRIPVALSPGSQTITMTLAGVDGETEQNELLTFAIEQIDLATQPDSQSAIPSPGASAGEVHVAYGSGWYAPESDGASTWRWAASPATFWIYSSQAQTVTLTSTPLALHDPAAADGKGSAGNLSITVNDQLVSELPVTTGALFTAPLPLARGWSLPSHLRPAISSRSSGSPKLETAAA